MAAGEDEALGLYIDSEQQGWETVKELRSLRLTYQEAEALEVRLGYLQTHLPAMRAAFWGEGASS